jgi:glycosyltransferase involved in cell wall biosynthesis
VGSALAQTVADLEVLIVGDGATDATRAAAEALAAADERVRFMDLPKGPGHGFRNRHAALGRIEDGVVLYLSDDDLWLPDHAERLLDALASADFAAAPFVTVGPDAAFIKYPLDLRLDGARELLRAGKNPLRLSAVGHRRAAYDALPAGWDVDREAGYEGVWLQFLEHPALSAAATDRPTVVHLPETWRENASGAEREAELRAWLERLGEPAGRERLWRDLLAGELTRNAELQSERRDLRASIARLKARQRELKDRPRSR